MGTLYRAMACLVLVCFTVSLSAQSPTVTPQQAIGLDYLDADMTAYVVTRFEVQWDGNGSWLSVGIPVAVKLPDTIPGGSTYKITPPFTGGNHTVSFRAVNAAGPSGASAIFPFVLVGASPAGVPTNIRVVAK